MWGLHSPPPSLLRCPCTWRQYIDGGFRPVQFREYFLCRISETKNSRKQETGTGYLVNRLVQENVNKCNTMHIKHVANDITWAWNIRNYRHVGDVSHIIWPFKSQLWSYVITWYHKVHPNQGVCPIGAWTTCMISFVYEVGVRPLGGWSWIFPHTNTRLFVHGSNLGFGMISTLVCVPFRSKSLGRAFGLSWERL